MKVILLIMLCLLPMMGFAQHAGLKVESVNPSGVSMESFSPLRSPLESIIGDPNGEWVSGNANRDLYRFDVGFGDDSLSVTRNFTQTRVEAKGSPFGTGVREDLTQGIKLSPLSGLSISMMRTQSETMDLGGQSLGASEVEALGLTQGYGRGTTAGTMSFSSTRTDAFAAGSDPLGARLSLARTVRDTRFGLSQGFSGGRFDYSRGMTSVQRPNLLAEIQNMESFGLSSTIAGLAMMANYERSSGDRPDQLQMQRRALSLTRKFNGVDAGVTYENVTRRISGVVEEATKQGYRIPLSLNGTPFAFAFDAATIQRNGLVLSDDRKASFLTRLGGNDISGSWARAIVKKDGIDNITSNMAFSLPINFRGSKILMDYSSIGTMVGNAITKKDRLATLAIPLGSMIRGSAFTHEIRGMQAAGKPTIELRTSRLILPFMLGGHEVTTDIQRISQRTDGVRTEQLIARASSMVMLFGRNIGTEAEFGTTTRDAGGELRVSRARLSVPFRPGPVIIERRSTRDESTTGSVSEVDVVNMVSPRVALGPRASMQADVMMTDQSAGVDQQVSHVSVMGSPAPRVMMTADVVKNEVGDRGAETLTVDTAYAVSDRLSVNARYLEKGNLDGGPLVNRVVMLQRKGDAGGLNLRAGVTSMADGVTDQPMRSLVEVGIGDARRMGVSLRYQEYDEAKLVGFSEPMVRLQLERGAPGSLRMVFGFEDQAGRGGPMRRYGIAIPVGRSSLDLGFSQNMVDPRDPKAARIRMASVYDAKYSATVFGDVTMDLGYRFFDPETAEAASWFQVRLSGGKAEEDGAIQLGYSSGDFVTLDVKPERTPTSTLSLRYDKRWTEDGTVSLMLNSSTVPQDQVDMKDSYETRVQLERRF